MQAAMIGPGLVGENMGRRLGLRGVLVHGFPSHAQPSVTKSS